MSAENYIMSELYRLLNQKISVSGDTIPFYSVAPKPSDAPEKYVTVNSAYELPGSTKDFFVKTWTINLEVVHFNTIGVLSIKTVSEIAHEIDKTLFPTRQSKTMNNSTEYNVIDFKNTGVRTDDRKSDTGFYCRRILELEVKISNK